jgi:histone deacetylase 1/2
MSRKQKASHLYIYFPFGALFRSVFNNKIKFPKNYTQTLQVAYFYDPDIGQFYYGQGHPMKPHRVRMAHSLILHYGLYSLMDCYRPCRASQQDLTAFHSEDYVAFLKTVTQDRESELRSELETYNMVEDCPVFDGLWDYCSTYSGASIGAAVKLNYGTADVAINWSGGLHHGKKSEASGFCYINDIVLAILELLKYHQRVLYIDIDVHHGDGVEEAFLTTDRVFTLSLHKFGGGFFPGTGDITNIGHGRGRNYSLNIPLKDGITDMGYQNLFKPIVAKIMEVYRPEVVVLQCGSDSLAGDRLGVFNLSSTCHSECVKYMKSFGVPLMLLGGGGYKIINVARCWARETGVALGVDMDENLPVSEYDAYYAPEYQLTVHPKPTQTDQNSTDYLESLRIAALEHLSHVAPAPSVAFHERAPDAMNEDGSQPVSLSPRSGGGGGGGGGSLPASPRGGGGKRQMRMWSGVGGSQSAADREAEELEAQLMNMSPGSSGRARARMDISYRDSHEEREKSSMRASMQPQQQQQQGAGGIGGVEGVVVMGSPTLLGSGGNSGGVRSPRPNMLRPASQDLDDKGQ